jgi:hypothetical protein
MKKNRQRLPLSLCLVQGAIGKEYVIKHYKWGTIRTKFPDMTRIIASAAQRKCRNVFKEAVVYAKRIVADKKIKDTWQKKLRRRGGVWNEAIKEYMLREKRFRQNELMLTEHLLWKTMVARPGRVGTITHHIPGEFSNYELELKIYYETKKRRKDLIENSLPRGKTITRSEGFKESQSPRRLCIDTSSQ